MADACSDCVSEQIAPAILKTLSRLLDEGDTKPLEDVYKRQPQGCSGPVRSIITLPLMWGRA